MGEAKGMVSPPKKEEKKHSNVVWVTPEEFDNAAIPPKFDGPFFRILCPFEVVPNVHKFYEEGLKQGYRFVEKFIAPEAYILMFERIGLWEENKDYWVNDTNKEYREKIKDVNSSREAKVSAKPVGTDNKTDEGTPANK